MNKEINRGIFTKTAFLVLFSMSLSSCNRDRNNPGWDYFPDMFYSTAYETYSKNPNFGFLKPIFRKDFLLKNSILYNENLIIGEDDDIILRSLIAGANYKFLYQPFYLYRKHGQSISHRLSSKHADLMLETALEFEPKMRLQSPEVRQAFEYGCHSSGCAWLLRWRQG